jgi:hypothetical protein
VRKIALLAALCVLPLFADAMKAYEKWYDAMTRWQSYLAKRNTPYIYNVKEKAEWDEVKKNWKAFEKEVDAYYEGR